MPDLEHVRDSQSVNGGGAEKPARSSAREKPEVSCTHPRADLADKHCRDCGADLTPVPVAGIEGLIEEKLRQHGLIGEGGQNPTNADRELRSEHDALVAAAEKQKGRLFGPGDTAYRTFAAYKTAKPADRAIELRRFGVEPITKETIDATKKRVAW